MIDILGSGIINIIILPVIGLIGWFIKVGLKNVSSGMEKQDEKLTSIQKQFAALQVSMVKIESTIISVEKDLDRASGLVEKTEALALKNNDRLTAHGHEIAGIKANMLTSVHLTQKNIDEIDKIKERINKLEINGKV